MDVLTDLYQSYQAEIKILTAPDDNGLKPLVTFDTCKDEPIHRWYPFKEGYSHKLLMTLQAEGVIPKESSLRFLDPFCGVGTTLLSCESLNQANTRAVGIERNPALLFIANAKLKWRDYRVGTVRRVLADLRIPKRGRRSVHSVPPLSTLTETRKSGKRAFEPAVLQELLFYREWIKEHCHGTPEYNFFMLAWTAIIERASNTRKDGRALRLLESSEGPSVKKLLVQQSELMLGDLEELRRQGSSLPSTSVIHGDAKYLPFENDSFSVLCYSPPYLNNIDYSEVYKLELWLREDITSKKEFRTLRLGTFRSHPSVAFPSTTICDELDRQSWIRRLKTTLLAALPEDKYLQMRRSLFSGYIDDLLSTLKEQARVTKTDAPIVCVVGNSLHGGSTNHTVPVCTDLLIAAAAQAVGLEVEHLQIARQLPRRDHQNGWLRETIIVMRKPRQRNST